MKSKEMARKEVRKEVRIQAKYVHVTLHKLKNDSKDYWVEKAMGFRSNVVAALVGLEENYDEGKGLHAHIVIQFSTRQDLVRRQFVEHFGSDTINVTMPKNKDGLLQVLGYAAKTDNTLQKGIFTSRGVDLDADPVVYKFQKEVKTKIEAIRYFKKIIKEHIDKDKNIIKKWAKREDAIGDYLVANPGVTASLHKLAHTWHLDHANEQKVGFRFKGFVSNKKELTRAYMAYLRDYRVIFEKYKTTKSELVLEGDFNQYASDDLEVLDAIIAILKDAVKYGSNRPRKSLNLYLWSKNPSFGKTRLLEYLDDHMMAYRLPDDQWYIDYENELYQVLVSDEAASFIKTKEYSHLKHIFEGAKVEFNLKGREKIYKEDNPLLVLADNVSFDELMNKYHKKNYDHDVMANRVLSLELKSRATLHFFLDRCIISGKVAKQQTMDV